MRVTFKTTQNEAGKLRPESRKLYAKDSVNLFKIHKRVGEVMKEKEKILLELRNAVKFYYRRIRGRFPTQNEPSDTYSKLLKNYEMMESNEIMLLSRI